MYSPIKSAVTAADATRPPRRLRLTPDDRWTWNDGPEHRIPTWKLEDRVNLVDLHSWSRVRSMAEELAVPSLNDPSLGSGRSCDDRWGNDARRVSKFIGHQITPSMQRQIQYQVAPSCRLQPNRGYDERRLRIALANGLCILALTSSDVSGGPGPRVWFPRAGKPLLRAPGIPWRSGRRRGRAAPGRQTRSTPCRARPSDRNRKARLRLRAAERRTKRHRPTMATARRPASRALRAPNRRRRRTSWDDANPTLVRCSLKLRTVRIWSGSRSRCRR